jgi:hypothetical protein
MYTRTICLRKLCSISLQQMRTKNKMENLLIALSVEIITLTLIWFPRYYLSARQASAYIFVLYQNACPCNSDYVHIAFRSDIKNTYPYVLGIAIFRGIIATERCCFAQRLKVVHSVSDRCFFAPLRKAIWYSGNVASVYAPTANSELCVLVILWNPCCRESLGS